MKTIGKGKKVTSTTGKKVVIETAKPVVSASAKKTAGQKKAAEKVVDTLQAQAQVAIDTTKSNAVTTAQPGIIASIMTSLLSAKTAEKPKTSGEILADLVAAFPERKPEGMMVTVRAQLSRLPKEKNFPITKQRDGREVRYAAA